MYCLRIVSLLALLTASIAQAQSNADKAALRVDADIFTSHLMNGDYGKVMQYQPPALTNEIAKRSGMSAKELLDLTVKSMAEVMMEMDIISSDFDLEETRFITQTEKVYAIIPTSMVITLNDGRNVRITNTTIGIRHNDGWYLIRQPENETGLDLFKQIYPFLATIDLPQKKVEFVE